MDKFQVIHPSVLLAPYVKQYWFLTMNNVVPSAQRLVPLGCVALTFHRAKRTWSTHRQDYLPQSYIYGIATGYTDLHITDTIDFITVIFQPQAAYAFFGMLVSELNNTCISLDALNDSGLNELEQRLQETTTNEECVWHIEQFLLYRLYRFDHSKVERLQEVINKIHKGETNLNHLAGSICLGYKQFKRIFTTHIGANPKSYLQMVRFRKLHHSFQQHTGQTLDQLAIECGYYDKSHLIKELKEFSGFTPGALLKACDPVYSPYHALFRLAFIDLPSQ